MLERCKSSFNDIDTEGGRKVEEEILNSGGEAFFIEQDVTSPEDWEEVRNQTLDKYNKIDVLINNAGIAIIKPLEETSEEEWDKTINVNLKSVFLGCKTFYLICVNKKMVQ